MNDGQGAKQQIVERVKDSSNILVTVSTNPSVDELSAALGLTVMLNNLKKHATAVVSGDIPPAITFLDPEKTFENTVDSLRDFIIALDKEKADHLRYKVDGDVVKIFITPYRTTIDENDLDFSQGDYNVEVVLALGVENKDHLDKALEAHGRILHDATVATISCGESSSNLGSIDWHESGASSISEMLVSLSEALKADKPLLDEQISTAFLTGIVAATDRFSNSRTSSKVMTMAAQLMAAGANQQLIAAKLSEANEISSEDSNGSGEPANTDGTTDLSEGTPSKLDKESTKSKKVEDKSKKNAPKDAPADDGSLAISHERDGDLDAVAKEVAKDNQADAAKKAEEVLANQLETVAPAASSVPSVSDIQKDIAAAGAEPEQVAEPVAPPPPPPAQSLSEMEMPGYEPTMGGTLNATTEQAAEDKRREEESDRNKTILSHSAPISSGSVPTFASSPINASMQPELDEPGIAMEPPLPPSEPTFPASSLSPQSAPDLSMQTTQPQQQTLADIDEMNRAPHQDAMDAVHAAFDASPAPISESQNTALPPVPGSSPPELGNPLASAPAAEGLPPLPDFTTLPPPPAPMNPVGPAAPSLPPAQGPEDLGQILGDAPAPQAAPLSSEPADPNQFRIPGQN